MLADPAWEKPAIGQFVTVTGVSSTYFDRGNTWRAVYVPSASGIGDVAVPTEFIVDEDAAVSTGSWTYNTGADAYNSDYQHTAAASAESATTTWRPTLPRAGNYNVYVMYSSGADRTADAVYTVSGSTGTQAYPVDQTTGGGTWQFLGMQTFTAGTSGHVRLTNVAPGVGTMVVADAVKFVYAGAPGSDPPVITTQPVSQSVCAGATVTFTVAATGSGTLNYQWRKGTADITDGGRYAGATTANLVVSSCDASDAAANYNCLVSSDYGSATSDNASLIVGAIPPAPAALAASAIGLDTITWNWGSSTGAASYRLWTAATGGTQIGGTLTGTSYVETGLNPGTSYSRYVEAVGQCGGVSSRTLLGPAVTTARYCVENGDFESGFTSGVANMWRKGSGTGTFARETAIKRDGTSSQKISDSSGGDQYTAYLYQKLNVQPNRGYAYQVYHRRQVTSGAVIRLGVNYTGGITADAVAESNGNSGEWKLKTLNFTSGATGVVTVMFCAGYNGGDTTVYVDGAYLLPQAPTATGGSTTISQGASATITASGGFGGSSSELHWYTGPNGTAAHVGTGTSLMVSPASTTVYYPRWQSASSCGGCCNSADGAPVTVTVNP